MNTTLEELAAWLSAPREIANLEFKEAAKQYDNTKLFKYCVAIGNEGGGKLICGVTDKLPRKVVGTKAFNDPAGIQRKILDKLNILVRVEELDHPDGRIVVFHIPSRALGTAYHLEGAYWMRSGEDLVPMTSERLREIFAEGRPDWLMRSARDGSSASGVVRLLDTEAYHHLLNLPYPARNAVLKRFANEKLIIEEG